MTVLSLGPSPERRAVLARRVRWLVAATITYNVVEAFVALSAGTVASSGALVAFEWARLHAAEAHRRITGDPNARAVPVLTGLAGPLPVGIRALESLLEIGVVPEELRHRLDEWAHFRRRISEADLWIPTSFVPDDDRLRALSLALLELP